MANPEHVERLLAGVDLARANLIGADLSGGNLEMGSLAGHHLTGVRLGTIRRLRFQWARLVGIRTELMRPRG
jgi:uncharacterized protein YjbI with pentapeptide repeats